MCATCMLVRECIDDDGGGGSGSCGSCVQRFVNTRGQVFDMDRCLWPTPLIRMPHICLTFFKMDASL